MGQILSNLPNPINRIRVNLIQPIVNEAPVEAPAQPAANGAPAGGFDNDKYATMKSAAQGLLNGSILLGNIFLAISLSIARNEEGVEIEMFGVTMAFLSMSVLFEFINAIIAIFLMTIRKGSAISVWFTFWAVLLSFFGLILNAIASYLVSQVTSQLSSQVQDGTSA